MSDSDMEIDDDDVHQVHTISGDSGLVATPIEASDSRNDEQSNGTVLSSFPLVNGSEQKRPCNFFAQARCDNGRFLHVKENTNCTSQQQVLNHIAGTSERRPLESKEGGRGSLQMGGSIFTDSRPVFVNSISSFPLRSSFVQEHGSAWTGPLLSPVPMNQYASNLGNFENRNDINGSGSLPMVEAISVSSNDWEPSEPFRASFSIPPYILPSSDALYYPFTDIEIPQDRSLTAPSSSKGKDAQKKSRQQKDDDSLARDCNNDHKNSSCSQNQYQETVGRKNMEEVATSVVDQNDEPTPSKEVSSSDNRVVFKRSKPSGHVSWRTSDGTWHKKVLKSDDMDGEVRSDAGTKAMRQFRNAVVETIKEMVKPLWLEGRLTKDVHNMVVKRASEKILSAAVQSHQVPTHTTSVDQYLSMSASKIVKLVEGYVEKYGKPKP